MSCISTNYIGHQHGGRVDYDKSTVDENVIRSGVLSDASEFELLPNALHCHR